MRFFACAKNCWANTTQALKDLHFYGSLLLYLVHFVMRFLWNWVIRSCLVYLYLAPQNWSHITQVHKTLESRVERTPGRGLQQQCWLGGRECVANWDAALMVQQGHTGASLLHIMPLISSPTLLDSPNKDIFDLICRNKNIQRDKLDVSCPKTDITHLRLHVYLCECVQFSSWYHPRTTVAKNCDASTHDLDKSKCASHRIET